MHEPTLGVEHQIDSLQSFCAVTGLPITRYGVPLMRIHEEVRSFDQMFTIWKKVQVNNDPNPVAFFNHFDIPITNSNGTNGHTEKSAGVSADGNTTPLSDLRNFCADNGLNLLDFPELIHVLAVCNNKIGLLKTLLAACPGEQLTEQIAAAINITRELTSDGGRKIDFAALVQKLEHAKTQAALERDIKRLVSNIIKFTSNPLFELSDKQKTAQDKLETRLGEIAQTELPKQSAEKITIDLTFQSLALCATIWDLCTQKGLLSVNVNNNAELETLFWHSISEVGTFLQTTEYTIADVITFAAECTNITTLKTKFAEKKLELKTRKELLLAGSNELPIISEKPDRKPDFVVPETVRGNRNQLLHVPGIQIYRLSSPDQVVTRAPILYMEIDANCTVTSLSTDQNTGAYRYEEGFHTVNPLPNTILLCTKPSETPKAFVTAYENGLMQIKEICSKDLFLPSSPSALLLEEIVEQLARYAHSERMQSPDFLLKLERGLIDLQKQHNIAPNLHNILDSMDAYETLDRDEQGKMLREKWKDLITGIFNGGWAISTGGQRLIETIHLNSVTSNLPPDELQKYFTAIFSYESLLQLFSKWRQAGYLDEQNLNFLTAENRYSVSGTCIWSYCEAATANIANSETKERVHKQLSDYCYKLKANTDQTVSYELFKSEASQIFLQSNETFYNYAPLWEYLYAEVSGDHTRTRVAYIDEIARVVASDSEVTKDAQTRRLFRREADGEPVSTLRYNNKSKQLVIRYTEDELYESDSPMRQFSHARIQSTGSTEELRLNISPSENQMLINTLSVCAAKRTESEFLQSSLEESLLWYALTQQFLTRPEMNIELESFDSDQVLENILSELQGLLQTTTAQSSNFSVLHDVVSRLAYAASPTQTLESAVVFSSSQVKDSLWVPLQKRMSAVDELLFSDEKKELTKEHLKRLLGNVFSNKLHMHSQLRQGLLRLLQDNIDGQVRKPLALAATKAVIKSLYLNAEQVISQIHGFGGGTESYDPLNEYVGEIDALPKTVIHTFTDKNSNGHGTVTFKGKVINVTRENGQLFPNFCTLGAGLQQKYKQRATPAYRAHGQFGHSMGALEALYARMLASRRVRENMYTFAAMPVSTNNETKVFWSDVIANIIDYPELHEQIVNSDQIANLLKQRGIFFEPHDSPTEILKNLLSSLVVNDQQISHHIPLLIFDSDLPVAAAIAGGVTGIATNPVLGDWTMEKTLAVGNAVGLNSTLLHLLIQNVQPPVAGIHSRELRTNPVNFIAHCRQILLNAPTLTKEEVLLLEKISTKDNLTIFLALNDVILKYQFFPALYPELVKFVTLAQNLGRNFKADHYALTDNINVINVTKMSKQKLARIAAH